MTSHSHQQTPVLGHVVVHRFHPAWPHNPQHPLPTAHDPALAASPHLLHLGQEGVSQVSGWLSRVPGHPVLSQQLIQQDEEGLLPRKDLARQSWDTQEDWDCVQQL
jgi:hypothetical protein